MNYPAQARFIRFKIDVAKCVEGIDYIASRQPDITQYYVCKVFYFADKEHIIDWGRPISGDRFVAMEHGPVPSFVYDLVKDTSGEPDEIIDALNARVAIQRKGNKIHLRSLGRGNYSALSPSDVEYLEYALEKYGRMPFGELKRISHEDPAYEHAWSQPGANNEMDITLWFDNQLAKDQLIERAIYGPRPSKQMGRD